MRRREPRVPDPLVARSEEPEQARPELEEPVVVGVGQLLRHGPPYVRSIWNRPCRFDSSTEISPSARRHGEETTEHSEAEREPRRVVTDVAGVQEP